MNPWRKSFGIWVPNRSLRDNRGFISPGTIGAVAGSRRRVAGTSYLISEGFESGALPTGWTNFTTAMTWNSDATAVSMLGSYCALSGATNTGGYASFSAPDTLWARFMFRTSTISVTPYIATLRNGSTALQYFRVLTTGRIRAYNGDGTTLATGSGITAAVDTTYYVWLKYISGGGADAAVSLYISADSTRPAAEIS